MKIVLMCFSTARFVRNRADAIAEFTQGVTVVEYGEAPAWKTADPVCERHQRDTHPGSVEGLRAGEWALRPGPRGPARRGAGVPRPERRREVDDHAAAARPDPADVGRRDGARARQPRPAHRDPPQGRVPAGRLRPLSEADRGGDAGLPRGPARRRRRRVRDHWRSASTRSSTARSRALDGQPPEARPDPGVHARARAAHPRRADRRARPAGAEELPRPARRGRGAGTHGLPLLAHPVRGRAGRRPRRDPAPRTAGRRRLAREPARDRGAAARHRVRRRRPRGRTAAGAPGRPRGDARRARTWPWPSRAPPTPLVKAARRLRGALDPQPGRRPRGDLPALLPRSRGRHELPRPRDGAAAADRLHGSRPRWAWSW